MLLGNRVMLEPDNGQSVRFWQFSGTDRFAWNLSKDFYESLYKEKGEYATIKDLMRHLQDLKHNNPDYAWLNDVPEAITKQAMKDLLKAYKAFYKNRRENFDPKNPDKFKPKFKKRNKSKPSFFQRTDNIRKTDNTHVKITGIKKPVKCTALKDVDLPEKIQNPRITFDGKYWYLSYSFEVDENDIVHGATGRYRLGIDLGVKDLAILSDGQHFGNINRTKEMRRLNKRLKRLQRQVSRKYEANATAAADGKKIYHKTNNIKKLETQIRHIYRRISNIRKTYMYEVIKAVMKTKSQSIVLEDLNVKGMMQNPHLARAVQEQNLSEFRRILTYKCQMYGIDLYIADRWYPSSKTCSCCGWYDKELKLSDRTFKCGCCGNEIDRDENAAINIEHCPPDKFKKIEFNAA